MIIQSKPKEEPQVDQESSQQKRDSNFCICFIGTNRTGKSSIAKKVITNWRQNNSGTIYAFDPQDNFNDLADVIIHTHVQGWKDLILDARNGLIIFDDYRLLHMKAMPQDWLVQLMNFRAKWNLDLVFITHSPALVLNYLTYYITHYFMFYTKAQQGSFESKIPDFDLCMKASDSVNTYVKAYGKGKYPEFPHIIVDTENEKLICQNMNGELYKKAIDEQKKKQILQSKQK